MMVRTQPEAQLIALTTGGDEGLRDERVIDLADPEAPPLPDHRLPPWQAAPVARRLCQLSAPARQLLEVAAVLGRSFWVHDLAEVVGQPVDRLLPSLREALDAGVIVSASQVMVFRDDLVCHVVRQGLPEAVRLALHRRIGRLLLSRGGCAQAAAGHLVRGARPGDRQALAGLDQAVSEVLPSSPQSAVQLALRALELTEPADAQRFTRTATAVDALVAAGRPAQAAKLARSVLDHPGLPSAPAARMRVTLAWVLLVSGQPCKAEAEAEAVLACPRLPAGLYADGQLVQLVAAAAGDPRLLQERAEAVLAGNGRGGDRALTGALAGLAVLAWDQGRAACALSLLRAAARRADRMPSHARHAYPRLGLAAKLTALGEFAEAEAAIGQAGQQIEHAGDTLWAPAPAICQAGLRLAAGRLDDAQAQAQAGLGLAEQLGARLFTPRARWVLACVALLRGDLVEAAEQVQRLGTEPAGSQTLLGVGACAFLHARLADAQQGLAGGLGHAVEVLADVYDDLPTHRRLLVEEPAAAGWLVRAALATGDRGRAEAVVACAEQLAADNRDFPSVAAAAAHARGLLDHDPATLAQAGADHRHPWAQASAWEDAGVGLALSGDHDGAGGQLQQALACYEQAGADRDAARVRSRLRDLGVRRRHWRHTDRPVSGWASLTDGERRVAALVAEGLTNAKTAERLFLSPHTIDFHLRQIFRKLGITSRVELTRLALQHRDDDVA